MAGGRQRYTVDEALVALGFGKFQLYVLAYAGMGWVAEAMEVMLLSFIGPAVKAKWKLSSHEESLITSMVFVGMMIGAYSWGIVSDRYGRRRGFLATAMVTSGAGFLSSFAPNYMTLIILRCIVGIGIGGGPVLASWVLEFIPAPSRGFWMVVFSAFWTFGTIFEASLAWLVMPKLGWRWLLALSSLPCSLLLIFYPATPESPRFLCLKGRTVDALCVLEKMAAMNAAVLPSGVLVSDHQVQELEERSVPSEDAHFLSPTRNNSVTEAADTGVRCSSLAMLFSPKLVLSTLLIWLVFFGNAFSYYGLVLLTSKLSNGHKKCIPAKLLSKKSEDVSYRNVFITSFAEFPGLLLAATMVDKLGRKLSMASMFFLCCLFLLPLLLYQPETVTTGLLFGARICITSTFTVIYIYAPEVYPTSIRATGVGVASSVGRIGGMVCPLVAVGLLEGCHQTVSIIIFEIVIFVSGICTLLFPFETKGRKLSDRVSASEQVNATLQNHSQNH